MSIKEIDGNRLKTPGMTINFFLINEKEKKSRFFKETFLLVDINIDIVFRISYLTLSNIMINFNHRKFR